MLGAARPCHFEFRVLSFERPIRCSNSSFCYIRGYDQDKTNNIRSIGSAPWVPYARQWRDTSRDRIGLLTVFRRGVIVRSEYPFRYYEQGAMAIQGVLERGCVFLLDWFKRRHRIQANIFSQFRRWTGERGICR